MNETISAPTANKFLSPPQVACLGFGALFLVLAELPGLKGWFRLLGWLFVLATFQKRLQEGLFNLSKKALKAVVNRYL